MSVLRHASTERHLAKKREDREKAKKETAEACGQ